MNELALVFKLLSDSSRLKILFSLENEPLSVSQVIERTGFSQPLVSFHLKALREAGLVVASRQGTVVFNSLCDDALIPLVKQFITYQRGDGKESSSFQCNCCQTPSSSDFILLKDKEGKKDEN